MMDRIVNMFHIVANEGHGSVFVVLVIGFFFGAIIAYSRLDKFEKMAGFMIFEDTLVPRMAMTTVALSSVGFYFLVHFGYATFAVKPILLTGLVLGAFLFGIGLVILGKCPSAFFVSVSEGRVDTFVGVLGGMVGGAIFTYLYPLMKVWMGPDLGTPQVFDYFIDHSLLVVLIFSTILLITAYFLPTIEFRDPADFKEKE
ncbi:YeeE/YedE thiosulfate transporter family protein [Sulfurimonas sp.]|uniref:YeeE/YedE thiosulfate transporter family protein n=1 Tax=Sulfurimonas sp. TaxID=2022749 RepID=UPI002635B157|nr:YeeE/YedE thiosulfate transporter family protein [Sulfurimonas sp.]